MPRHYSGSTLAARGQVWARDQSNGLLEQMLGGMLGTLESASTGAVISALLVKEIILSGVTLSH